MHYIKTMLDELVKEGLVVCVYDVETGYSYYSAIGVSRMHGLVHSFILDEAIASCELDRGETYSIG